MQCCPLWWNKEGTMERAKFTRHHPGNIVHNFNCYVPMLGCSLPQFLGQIEDWLPVLIRIWTQSLMLLCYHHQWPNNFLYVESVFIQYWLIFCERCYVGIILGFVDLIKENITVFFWSRMGYRCQCMPMLQKERNSCTEHCP